MLWRSNGVDYMGDIGSRFSFWLTEPDYIDIEKSKQTRGRIRNRYEGVAVSRPLPNYLRIKIDGQERHETVRRDRLTRIDACDSQ